jgi:alkylhydroperoxidase family enzyme
MARIDPLPPGTLPDDVRAALQGWLRPDATEVPAPLDTLVRRPDLVWAFLTFNRHLLFESTLTARIRELLILRTAALCDCAFERAQHEIIARREGIRGPTRMIGPDPDGAMGRRRQLRSILTWTRLFLSQSKVPGLVG